MAHGDAREGKWRGNWRMEWVASTLHTTLEHGVSIITNNTTADAHTSAASSRLNWIPCRFKWILTFRRKTKSSFCACFITFQTHFKTNKARAVPTHAMKSYRSTEIESSWNVMTHGDVREGKWWGNWRMEWVASTLYTISELGLSIITTCDAHTSAASNRLNWRTRRFKWTRPFRRKRKSGFCACAIAFKTQSTFLSVTLLSNCATNRCRHPKNHSADQTYCVVNVTCISGSCILFCMQEGRWHNWNTSVVIWNHIPPEYDAVVEGFS
jgi:hypothetical protein